MNKIILASVALTVFAAMTACKDEASYMPQIEQMKDSVFNTYPTVGAITIKVKDEEIKIVVGDEQLYSAAADVKAKEAVELGQMVIRIFGKGSYLRTGALVITKDLKNSSEKPADGITVPINIDSLKQVINK